MQVPLVEDAGFGLQALRAFGNWRTCVGLGTLGALVDKPRPKPGTALSLLETWSLQASQFEARVWEQTETQAGAAGDSLRFWLKAGSRRGRSETRHDGTRNPPFGFRAGSVC